MFQHETCSIKPSVLVLHLFRYRRVFSSFLFNVVFISFSFLCCAFSVTLSCRCFGLWPKEPAGLKTLRLVSMPSWRHANSEEQEEEDDDDVVGPPGDTSIPAGIAGPQRV